MARPRAVPASALTELRLVREVLAEHDCSQDSLACRMGVCKATVSRWLDGSRPAPPMVVAVLQHDPDVALDLLVRLCGLAGIDLSDVLLEAARRQVRRDALLRLAGELVDQAEQLPAVRRAA